MNRVSVINRLSASGGPFAGNKAALEAMSDAGLSELEKAFPEKVNDPNQPATTPNPNPPVEPATPVNTPPSTPTPAPTTQTESAPVTETVSISREDYNKFKAASDALEAQVAARKAKLVTSLSAAQSEFASTDLQSMDTPILEKMAKAFKVDQPAGQASYVALPVSGTKPAMRELPDPLGLKVHSLRPDGNKIETAN